ncbi:sigma-70 family RNA polymerase sigma factor [Epibacterium sp. DP7N7-1]|nr:RNA polymerase sigma factor, sigma-70 family [Ruegeria sp. TrichCH4B]MBW3241241.1 sigma-70 family RNA polymerase sigma factor [Epibacterium sp. DP7N7-1]
MSELAERIKACAEGDRAALRAIMDAEGSRLLGIAIRMLRRRDLAEDAVQECFVSLWRKAHQFDANRGAARGWLTTILRNQCLTMLRKESWEIAEDAETLERRQDEDIVMDAYGRLDANSDLRRCLDRLEPPKRIAILQAYVLGYTHGEISGRIQAPLGSVKAWVRRGLIALRECLS